MRIKNISSTEIKISDLSIFLTPGEVGDLSHIDQAVLHTHKKLNAYFEKGLLVNLGLATPAGSIAALKSARERITKMGLNDYIVKPSRPQKSNNRKKINELLKKADRNQSKQGFDSRNERYSDEYYRNMNPATTREDYSQPIPRPKIDDKFRSMQVHPDGIISDFGSYGIIETEILTGETTALRNSPPSTPSEQARDNIQVTDREGNAYNVSLKGVQEKTKRKCIGFTSSGKACKKFAVHGFQSCLTHMSRSEKKEYEKLKRNSQVS